MKRIAAWIVVASVWTSPSARGAEFLLGVSANQTLRSRSDQRLSRQHGCSRAKRGNKRKRPGCKTPSEFADRIVMRTWGALRDPRLCCSTASP